MGTCESLEGVIVLPDGRLAVVEIELDPPQPEPVAAAVAEALAAEPQRAVDPWWRAGVQENLRGE